MDTFKKAIYEQNKQFLEYIIEDFLSVDSDDKDKKKFMEKYHKLHFSYMIPTHNEVNLRLKLYYVKNYIEHVLSTK